MPAPAALIPAAVCGLLFLRKKKRRRGSYTKKEKHDISKNKLGNFKGTDFGPISRYNDSLEISELWIHENVVREIESGTRDPEIVAINILKEYFPNEMVTYPALWRSYTNQEDYIACAEDWAAKNPKLAALMCFILDHIKVYHMCRPGYHGGARYT